jgi:uncharacterized membrane protein
MRTTASTTEAWDGLAESNERTAVATGVTTLAILGVAFGAMALGIPYFWIVFPVGFGGVLPLVMADSARRKRASSRDCRRDSTGGRRDAGAGTTDDEALRTLRSRYARGELSDTGFERRLERLLETETVADAARWRRSRGPSDTGDEDRRSPSAPDARDD